MKDSNQDTPFFLLNDVPLPRKMVFSGFCFISSHGRETPHNDDLSSYLEMVTTQVDF